MSKDKSKKRYTGEFKQQVVEAMQIEKLSYSEAARQFHVSDHKSVAQWERIYLEEGPEGLYVERRGRASAASGTQKGRKPKLNKNLIAENQRLRAEVDYLKKLNALVLEEERRGKRRK